MSKAQERIGEIDGAQAKFFACDASDAESVKSAFSQVVSELGPVNVLVYNASAGYGRCSILELTEEKVLASLRVNTIGALYASQQVLPNMIQQGSGTILFSSATSAFRGSPNSGAFAMAKHALKALSQTVAKEHAKDGVHACHIRIDCGLDGPLAKQYMGDQYDPSKLGNLDQIAETYFFLSQQGKNGWTNEIDIRPFKETWTC